MIKGYRDLEVWQKAHRLVLSIYETTQPFPSYQRFGLVSQLRRAAYSVPANIAEGFGRRHTKELLQTLAIANGSIEEMRYFLLLSRDLRYIKPETYADLEREAHSVAQMLAALARSLRARTEPSSRATHSRNTGNGPRDT